MDDCVFCKIIKGEIPCYKLYEDDYFIVFLDRFPSTIGHTLIVPKKHFANVYELDTEYGERIFPLVTKYANALKEAYNLEGLNVLQNNGEVAGQSVLHFHVHLIPRKKDDDITLAWKPKDPEEKEFLQVIEKINQNLKDI